ncbi:MAG: STAS-like domain-containing protein [Nitrospinaceae bacterium]
MEKEITIKVFDIVQTGLPQGRTSQDGFVGGDVVRQRIEEEWDKFEKIYISFEDIIRMTRTFTDEAIAKLLEKHSLEEFNQKIFFPDAKEELVKDLNNALKLRLKILTLQRERAEGV